MANTPVEQIKERLPIEDVIGSYVKLERSGKSLKARCPFHNEKTPSFYVSPERGGYFCFGCGAKGDIFSFVEQFEGLDFMGALKLLAERAGVDISKNREGFREADYAKVKTEKERMYAIMEEATVFFEENLAGQVPRISDHSIYAVASREAREYVAKRGITDVTVKEFRIGFVPEEWRLLYTHLKAKGYSDAEIEKAGLAKRPEAAEGKTQASLYDRFRDRVMFPISDSSGRVIAFSGRILHDKKSDGANGANGSSSASTIVAAKYLNSPDTPLYNKSTVLYGIDKAKQAIRERGYTIFVEGQMDLVLSHQAGIKNTVAVSGTALADTLSKEGVVNNLGIVRRLSDNLILAFDSDAAGRKAAMRSAEIALSLGMDVKIADLPEGADPADMVLANPESWKDALRHAKPVVEFQLDRVMAEVADNKLDQRKVPALLKAKVYPFIAMLASRSAQAQYVKMVRERALGNAENEAVIWEDIAVAQREYLSKQHVKIDPRTDVKNDGNAGQTNSTNGTILANAERSRLDIITRKLFGLLAYIAQEKGHTDSLITLDVDSYTAAVRKIAGEERYNNLIQHVESSKDELIGEAELFFGSGAQDANMQTRIKKQLDELLLNFEEDILRKDFAVAMAQLSDLERKKEGHKAQELLAQCQKYSVRIADIVKQRRG